MTIQDQLESKPSITIAVVLTLMAKDIVIARDVVVNAE
jgi:hypothetical protein